MAKILLLLLTLITGLQVCAQDYPKAPIKAVVTFPPGGPADVMARIIQPVLEKNLSGAVWIENRAGDGGWLGFAQVAQSKPDGYTILVTTSAPLTLGTAMRKLPYSMDDFEALGAFGTDSTAIVSRPDAPWKNFDEFLSFATRNPNKLSYASPGSATAPYLTMEAVRAGRDLVFTAVHYPGTNPVNASILGGHTDFAVGGFAAMKNLVQSKKLIVLAITGQRRDPDYPDIPTLEEKGFALANIGLWSGVWAPKGTPKDILAKISRALEQSAKDPVVIEHSKASGYGSLWLASEGMRDLSKQDHERAQKIMKLLKPIK